MFISDKFYLDGIHCDEIGVSLITLNNDIINDYGIGFDKNVGLDSVSYNNPIYYNEVDNVEDVILNICPSNEYDLTWDNQLIEDVYKWILQDRFMPFISEDDLDLIYYFKPIKITKKFSAFMEGYLEVTFKPLSNYAYKRDLKKSSVVIEKVININNVSNSFEDYYSPVIELENLGSFDDEISITNLTLDSEPMVISGLSKNEKIVIDNAMCTVLDSNNNNILGRSNRKWLKLKKGSNSIKVVGNCNIVIKSEFPCFR